MAATTGTVPRFQLSRNNTTLGHNVNPVLPSMATPKSAASAAGLLDSNVSQSRDGDGSKMPDGDPGKIKIDKSTSSFKRQLAAARNSRNDETIRRKMAQLQEQKRNARTGGTKTPIQRDMEAEAKSRVETELGRPVSSNDWPFVYFVVSVDQQPQQIIDGDGAGDGTARSMHTARQRQRLLVSRRRKVQEAREETERIREANIDMGLRLEPIKPKAQALEHQQQIQRMRTRPSLSKHPTTPVSSVGSRHDFFFLNSNDDLTDLETRRNIGMIISDTLNEVGMGPRGNEAGVSGGGTTADKIGPKGKHCPVSTLELPEISATTKRRALGTSQGRSREDGGERKMVTFADGLPVIKGNGIPVLGVKPVDANLPQSASASCPTSLINKPGMSQPTGDSATGDFRAGVMGVGGGGGNSSFLQPPWSAPLTLRSMSSITPKSRMYTPMALPKIDIVSEIYDELIVKTIQNYLMAEGYSQEKFHQLRQTVLARLSATYPHLVKHKAWRQEAAGGDGFVTSTRDSSAIPAPNPGMTSAATVSGYGENPLRSRAMRSGALGSRHGRSSVEPGPTISDGFFNVNHNVRPANMYPFFYPTTSGQQFSSDFWMVGAPASARSGGFPISPSPFMSIDGRTMTITPRLSPHSISLGAVPVQATGNTAKLEALPTGGGDFIMSGWTPPPAAANNRLLSMEEEPTLKHRPSEQAVSDGSSPLETMEGKKEKVAEMERAEIERQTKENASPETVEVEKEDKSEDDKNTNDEGKNSEGNNDEKPQTNRLDNEDERETENKESPEKDNPEQVAYLTMQQDESKDSEN